MALASYRPLADPAGVAAPDDPLAAGVKALFMRFQIPAISPLAVFGAGAAGLAADMVDCADGWFASFTAGAELAAPFGGAAALPCGAVVAQFGQPIP